MYGYTNTNTNHAHKEGMTEATPEIGVLEEYTSARGIPVQLRAAVLQTADLDTQ